jgi:hypothetical protein
VSRRAARCFRRLLPPAPARRSGPGSPVPGPARHVSSSARRTGSPTPGATSTPGSGPFVRSCLAATLASPASPLLAREGRCGILRAGVLQVDAQPTGNSRLFVLPSEPDTAIGSRCHQPIGLRLPDVPH